MELKKNQVNPKEKNKLEQSPTTIYKNRLFEIVNDLMIKHSDITEDKLMVRAKIMLEKENMKKKEQNEKQTKSTQEKNRQQEKQTSVLL